VKARIPATALKGIYQPSLVLNFIMKFDPTRRHDRFQRSVPASEGAQFDHNYERIHLPLAKSIALLL
jgi:hypothetical protein